MGVVFFLPFVFMLIAFVIFMMFYPRFYKRKINKDLEQGKPIKVIEPVYLYGGIMFVILLVMMVTTNASIRNLEDRMLFNTNNKIQAVEFEQQRLLEEFWRLNDNIDREIAQDAYIQFVKYEVIEKVENQEDLYLVKLTFYLNEHSEDKEVKLVVESSSGDQEILLSQSTVRQSVELELYLYEDYLFYVEVDDGEQIILHDFSSFNLYNYLYDRFTTFVELDTVSGDFEIYFYLMNVWANASSGVPSDLLKIEEVHMQILSNGEEVYNEVITSRVSSSHYEQYTELITFTPDEVSGSVQVIITVTDELGITYDNLLN